jgi:hypothetical protein
VNYIDTLLERQSAWFLRLLGAGEAEPSRQEQEAETSVRQAAEERAPLDTVLPAGVAADEADRLARRSQALRLQVQQSLGLSTQSGGAEGGTLRRSPGENPAALLWEGNSGRSPDPAREADAVTARALSRSFERDARRYDGGFTLY